MVAKRLILSIILILLLACIVEADVFFYDDCEDAPNTATDYTSAASGGSSHAAYSTDYARSGSGSYKFVVVAGSGIRSELIPKFNYPGASNNNLIYEHDYWYGWSFYLPSDWQEPTGYALCGQFHASYVNCGTGEYDCDNRCCGTANAAPQPYGISIDLANGTDANPKLQSACAGQDAQWNCESDCTYLSWDLNPWTTGLTENIPINRGAWNDVVVHYKPSLIGEGISQLWVNGVLYKDLQDVINATNDALGPYFKFGWYHTSTRSHTIYYDEIRIAENASYAEVAPGGAVNIAPTVTISPSTTQTISETDSVNFSCTASDSDGTIASYAWDFDDSGISADTVEDPGNKQFNTAGTYTIRVTVTDDDGATASDTVTVIVGAGGITGLIHNWNMESDDISDDEEENGDLTWTGSPSTSETEPALGYGTHGVVLNGTSQYATATLDASAPWETGQTQGTVVLLIKTTATDPAVTKYLAGKFDVTGGQRSWAAMLSSSGMQPLMNIGVNSGASYENKYFGTALAVDSYYCLFYSADSAAKTWSIRAYDIGNTEWLTPASGSITGDMYLGSTATFRIGRRSDESATSYLGGTIYLVRLYNTVLTQGECDEFISSYVEPTPGTTIEQMFVCDCDTGIEITGDMLYFNAAKLCVKVVFPSGSWNYSGPYSNFKIPFTLDSGTLDLFYKSGAGTNSWIFEGQVSAGDLETGNLALSAVSDLDRDNSTTGTDSAIVDESGTELTSYDLPQTAAHPTHKVWIWGQPAVRFAAE